MTSIDRAGAWALTLLAAANTAFAAITLVLAMMVQPAAAAAATTTAKDSVCGGDNLFAQLQEADPAAHAAVLAEARATSFSDTLLYRIEKDGAAPSWLFGTMHMTDPRIVQLSPKVQTAFDAAETLVIETDEILDITKAQLALLSRPDLQMFTDGARLSDFIEEEDRAVLDEGLAQRGLQLALIDRMKPWMVTGMVALPACEMQRKQAGEPFLDIALAERAAASGKDVRGLETIVEQLDAMASLPIEFHVQGLVETIKLGDMMDDVIETMIQLYLDENIAAVMPTLEHIAAEATGATDAEGYAAFEEKIITNRNRIMAERAAPMLDEGGVFLAVGALHLPGEEGVAQLLQDAGYTITPVRD